jgi:hypothetical protein
MSLTDQQPLRMLRPQRLRLFDTFDWNDRLGTGCEGIRLHRAGPEYVDDDRYASCRGRARHKIGGVNTHQ